MARFTLDLLTPTYDKNSAAQIGTAHFLRTRFAEFYSQGEDYQNKNSFSFSFNEKVSLHKNAQKELSFSMNANYFSDNSWLDNPFVKNLHVGSQILLVDKYDNEFFFTIKDIKYSLTDTNIQYDYSCQDSFSYQLTRQNDGYEITNDINDENFIGAKNIDIWTNNYIVKDCQIVYQYIPLNMSVFIDNDGKPCLHTEQWGTTIQNSKKIVKQAYSKEKFPEYYQNFTYSGSGSALNILIDLSSYIDFQIVTFEHSIPNSNTFVTYFWYEPTKKENISGLSYSPYSDIESFNFSFAGDSLTTVLNVASNELAGDRINTLFPTLPSFFAQWFTNSAEWNEKEEYYPGFFTEKCKGTQYNNFGTYNKNTKHLFIEEPTFNKPTESTKIIEEISLHKAMWISEDGFYLPILNEFDLTVFDIPVLYDNAQWYQNNEYSSVSLISGGSSSFLSAETHIFQLRIFYAKDGQWRSLVYGKDTFQWKDLIALDGTKNYKPYLYISYPLSVDPGVSSEITISNIKALLYFSRTATEEDLEFAHIADNCPWLENKIIDLTYFLNQKLITKYDYTQLLSILSNQMRIINSKLLVYSTDYYNALHKQTQILSNITNSIDSLGAAFHADVVNTYARNGVVKDITTFKTKYNEIFNDNYIPQSLLSYENLLTDYGNKYFNAQQRFLKNIYLFRKYWDAPSSYGNQNSAIYTDTFKIESGTQTKETLAISFDDSQWDLVSDYKNFTYKDANDTPLVSLYYGDNLYAEVTDVVDKRNYQQYYVADDDNKSFITKSDNALDNIYSDNIKYYDEVLYIDEDILIEKILLSDPELSNIQSFIDTKDLYKNDIVQGDDVNTKVKKYLDKIIRSKQNWRLIWTREDQSSAVIALFNANLITENEKNLIRFELLNKSKEEWNKPQTFKNRESNLALHIGNQGKEIVIELDKIVTFRYEPVAKSVIAKRMLAYETDSNSIYYYRDINVIYEKTSSLLNLTDFCNENFSSASAISGGTMSEIWRNNGTVGWCMSGSRSGFRKTILTGLTHTILVCPLLGPVLSPTLIIAQLIALGAAWFDKGRTKELQLSMMFFNYYKDVIDLDLYMLDYNVIESSVNNETVYYLSTNNGNTKDYPYNHIQEENKRYLPVTYCNRENESSLYRNVVNLDTVSTESSFLQGLIMRLNDVNKNNVGWYKTATSGICLAEYDGTPFDVSNKDNEDFFRSDSDWTYIDDEGNPTRAYSFQGYLDYNKYIFFKKSNTLDLIQERKNQMYTINTSKETILPDYYSTYQNLCPTYSAIPRTGEWYYKTDRYRFLQSTDFIDNQDEYSFYFLDGDLSLSVYVQEENDKSFSKQTRYSSIFKYFVSSAETDSRKFKVDSNGVIDMTINPLLKDTLIKNDYIFNDVPIQIKDSKIIVNGQSYDIKSPEVDDIPNGTFYNNAAFEKEFSFENSANEWTTWDNINDDAKKQFLKYLFYINIANTKIFFLILRKEPYKTMSISPNQDSGISYLPESFNWRNVKNKENYQIFNIKNISGYHYVPAVNSNLHPATIWDSASTYYKKDGNSITRVYTLKQLLDDKPYGRLQYKSGLYHEESALVNNITDWNIKVYVNEIKKHIFRQRVTLTVPLTSVSNANKNFTLNSLWKFNWKTKSSTECILIAANQIEKENVYKFTFQINADRSWDTYETIKDAKDTTNQLINITRSIDSIVQIIDYSNQGQKPISENTDNNENVTKQELVAINSFILPIHIENYIDKNNDDGISIGYQITGDKTLAVVNDISKTSFFINIKGIQSDQDIRGLTNGEFWTLYSNSETALNSTKKLLFEHAAFIETELTNYWTLAYNASKMCEFFLPESWQPNIEENTNFFKNWLINYDSAQLQDLFIPRVEIYTDENNQTEFQKYTLKYGSNPDTDNQDTIGILIKTNQYENSEVLKNNEVWQELFNQLGTTYKEWVIQPQENVTTVYYHYLGGGTRWKELLPILKYQNGNFKEFSGTYPLMFKMLYKRFYNRTYTLYEQYKKAHDSLWLSLRMQYPGVFLEKSYSDENATTPALLLQSAQNYMKDLTKPEKRYNISIIDINSLSNYKGQELTIGDPIALESSEYYRGNDIIKDALNQYLFISDISYTLRSDASISLTVNSIKYQDKLIQRLVKLIK